MFSTLRRFSKASTKVYAASFFVMAGGGLAFKYYATQKLSSYENAEESNLSSSEYDDSTDFNNNSLYSDGFIRVSINGKTSQAVVSNDYHNYYKDEPRAESFIKYRNIDIVLRYIHPSQLPYADEPLLNPEQNKLLKKHEITRESYSSVTFRGDGRSYDKIKNVGGFHPLYTIQNEDQKESALDVIAHRNEAYSGFVSTTRDVSIAHRFGADQRNFYSIYGVEAIGAMGPSKILLAHENEYSVPGGIDLDSVITVRNCKTEHIPPVYERSLTFAKCGDIFFNRKYAEKYPRKAKKIVEAQLFVGESIDKSSESTLHQFRMLKPT
jgi:hypothetical protein